MGIVNFPWENKNTKSSIWNLTFSIGTMYLAMGTIIYDVNIFPFESVSPRKNEFCWKYKIHVIYCSTQVFIMISIWFRIESFTQHATSIKHWLSSKIWSNENYFVLIKLCVCCDNKISFWNIYVHFDSFVYRKYGTW